jgi:hypothetical protein
MIALLAPIAARLGLSVSPMAKKLVEWAFIAMLVYGAYTWSYNRGYAAADRGAEIARLQTNLEAERQSRLAAQANAKRLQEAVDQVAVDRAADETRSRKVDAAIGASADRDIAPSTRARLRALRGDR